MSLPIMKEQQKQEIETMKEKKITVKLSDADCDKLIRKCGEYGITAGELIENFIRDLVGSTYSNGSDERDYIEQWFERCYFGEFPKQTLLNHLLNSGYEPKQYLKTLQDIESTKKDIESTEKAIKNPNEEWKQIVRREYREDRISYVEIPCYNSLEEYIEQEKECLEIYKEDLKAWTEELNTLIEDWKPEKEPNMDEEIVLIKKWVKEKEDLIIE